MPSRSEPSSPPPRPVSPRASDSSAAHFVPPALLDHMEEALFCVDDSGTLQDLNAAAATFLNAPQADLRGCPIREAIPPASDQAFHDRCLSARHNGPVAFDAFFPSLDRWGRVRAIPLPPEAPADSGVAIYLRDITAEKQHRDQLEEERQRLELALIGGDLGLWDLNFNDHTNVVNDRWAEMLGYAPEEVDSSLDFFNDRVHPDDLPRAHEAMRRHIRGETPFIDIEIRVRAKDGSWRWILDRGKILEWNDDGSPRRAVGTHMDITDRKEQEQALRESKIALEQAQAMTRTGNGVIDLENDVLTLSPEAGNLLGLPAGTSLSIATFSALVHPADQAFVSAEFDRVGAGHPHDAEYRVVPLGRTDVRWLRARGRPERGNDGRVRRVFATITDITEEKRQREALREERNLLQRVFDASPAAIVVLNADGFIVRASARTHEVLGVSPEALKGRRYNDPRWGIAAPNGDPLPDTTLPFAQVMQHGTPVFDVEHTIEDEAGDRRLFSISGAPLFQDAVPADGAQAPSGAPSGAVFVLQDITEQRASERALRRSEERFRVATEQAVDVVALFNPDGTVQYVSPSVEQITGFDRASFIGNDGFALVHPDDYERLLEAFNTALHHPDTPVEVVGRYRHRDGSWRHLSIRGRRITSQDGTPQVLANIRDVTDAKHRRAALLDAKQAAEDASALKSAMLANMSHEVRTPLTTVIGFADMLADLDLGDTPNRIAGLIHKSAHRLLDTLEGVLDLSRLEADAVDLDVTSISLQPFLADLIEAFQGQAQQKEVALTHRSPPSLTLATDPRALRGVLNNLVSNALKFTEAGGTVAVRAQTDGSAVVLTVTDDGIGMDPDFVAEAFQAFRQESTGNSREFEGSGLGLAICEHYVDLLGGTIHIESEKGVGTTVTVRLPQRS